MAFKFVVAFALVAVAFAGYVPQPQVYHDVAHQEPSQHVLTKSVEEYDPHPQYNVAYNVHDSVTGDVKSQSESRDGDVVNGEYSLIDADGYKRTVSYSADDEHGFNAVVNRVPLNQAEHGSHALATAAPAIHASPSHTYAAAPAAVKTYTAPSYHHQAAPAVAKTVSYGAPGYYHQAAPSAVVKTVSPVSYGAPSYYHQAAPSAVVKTVSPVSYGAPSYHHEAVSAPVAYSAPSAVSPVSYAVPSYHQVVAAPTVSYSAPSHYKPAPSAVTYSTSNVVAKSASPVTYSVAAAPRHAEHQYVASSPSYAVPVNYHAHPESVYVASSPSVAKTTYHKSAPSVAYATSESYSSPAYVKSSESSNQYHH